MTLREKLMITTDQMEDRRTELPRACRQVEIAVEALEQASAAPALANRG